jgi:hypothetical protein
MRRALWVVAVLAGGLTACATVPTPTERSSACKPFTGEIPGVTELMFWTAPDRPAPDLPKGFLRLHYVGDDPVFAIAVHYVDVDHITVPFIVGPIKGVPWDAKEALSPRSQAAMEWSKFFGKLREIRSARPGGLLCGNQDCGKSPEVPPPDFVGTGSSGGGGASAAIFIDPPQKYAELMSPLAPTTASASATDARAVAGTPEARRAVVISVVNTTCHGVQAMLGRE